MKLLKIRWRSDDNRIALATVYVENLRLKHILSSFHDFYHVHSVHKKTILKYRCSGLVVGESLTQSGGPRFDLQRKNAYGWISFIEINKKRNK